MQEKAITKINKCYNCNQPKPKISYKSTENIITMTYKQKTENKKSETKLSVELDVYEITKIFENETRI